MNLKESNAAGGSFAWNQERQALFTSSDVNGDGQLDQAEGQDFYSKVRKIDGKAGASDTNAEQLGRTWNVASQLSSPYDYMSFQDYLNLEKLMEIFYEQGKLELTGHAKGSSPGEDLSHQCKTLRLADDYDKIVYMQIVSGLLGVSQISVQTNTDHFVTLGLPATGSDPIR